MEVAATEGPWAFLLRPWRYDFEYARAWRELDFPLYGVVQPEPTVFRMGARAGVAWSHLDRFDACHLLCGPSSPTSR